MINGTHVVWKRQLQVMKPRSITFNLILRLKIRFGFHLRATDLSLRAIAKHHIACCMRYSLISKGPVLQIPVPKSSSVTGKFYRESVLTQLVDFYQKRRPRTCVCGIKLLHDNAPAHKSATVQEYLKESGLDVLDHSPYSSDLSPCDFWLFPRLKEMLAGQRFESRCGKGSAVYQCLQHIPTEDYQVAFRKWVDQCKMCVEADVAYFEGLRQIKF